MLLTGILIHGLSLNEKVAAVQQQEEGISPVPEKNTGQREDTPVRRVSYD